MRGAKIMTNFQKSLSQALSDLREKYGKKEVDEAVRKWIGGNK